MIKKVFSVLIIMIIAANANAIKLDLLPDQNKKNVRVGSSNASLQDSVYVVKVREDSICIDEIVVASTNNDNKLMTVILENDTLFQDMIKNSMTVDEMKDKKFSLKPGCTYTVSWGNDRWTIKLEELPKYTLSIIKKGDGEDSILFKAEITESIKDLNIQMVNDQEYIIKLGDNEYKIIPSNNVEPESTKCTTVIVGIICLVIGLLLGIKRKKIKKLFKKKVKLLLGDSLKPEKELELDGGERLEEVKCSDGDKDEKVGMQDISNPLLADTLKPEKELELNGGELPEEVNCSDGVKEAIKEDIVNTIISEWGDKFDQKESWDDKITRLKDIIDDYYNLLNEKDTLIRLLKLKVGATIDEIINEINNKITSVSQSLPSSDDLKKEIEGFIFKYKEIKECYLANSSEADSFKKRIERLFSKLDYALRTAEKSKEEPLQELQERLKHMTTADMRVANNFVLEKLKDAGIGNFISIVANTKLETVLQDLTRKLKIAVQADERGTDQEIVSKAVNNNDFTDNDKRVILQNLVEKINENIDDDDKKLSDVETFEQFYCLLSTSLVVPNSYEEAENKGRKIVLDSISAVLGLKVADSDELGNLVNTYFEKRLQTEFLSKLKGLDVEKNTEMFDKIDIINNALKDSLDISELFEKFNVDYVKQIPNAIIKDDAEKIKKTLAGKSEFSKELELDKCTSSEQIVNRLVRALGEANQKANAAEENKNAAEIRIINELKGCFKALANEDMQEPETVSEAFGFYRERVNKSISEINSSLEKVNDEKIDLQTKVEEQGKKVKIQKSAIDVVTSSAVNNFKRGVDALDEILRRGGFLKPCKRENKDICSKNEERIILFMDSFRTTAEAVSFEDKLPSEIFESVQLILASECAKEDGVFNLISRYYAYSRLPFMTDKSREYGVWFDRSVLSNIYTVVDKLLSDFGCRLIVPTLFSERITEGEYEDCTGAAFGDLDNLCPNSVNYKEFIANSDKKDVIIDIIHVGYRMNGSVKMKTKVLI